MTHRHLNRTVVTHRHLNRKRLLNHLHWENLLSKLSAILHHCLTCLGHVWLCDTDRIVFISVALPKVAKASTSVSLSLVIVAGIKDHLHW